MQIKDMNSEELKALIENTIDETLESYFGDPDEGKTLKEEVKQRLSAIRQRREAGKKGIPAAEVYQHLGLKP
jgi:uncharacterized protein YicC (UPF0701 family)